MEATGEITIKMPIEEANDLKMELCDIFSLIFTEAKDNHIALIAMSALYTMLQSVTEQGEEHKTWDRRINVND